MIRVINTLDRGGAEGYCHQCRDNVENWVEVILNAGSETSTQFTLCTEHAFTLAYKLMAAASEA